jgi:hypothetical protein
MLEREEGTLIVFLSEEHSAGGGNLDEHNVMM